MPEMKTKKEKLSKEGEEMQQAFDALKSYLSARVEGFKRVLPEQMITVERFTSTVLFNVWKNPKLLQCNFATIFYSAMSAAKLGLEPDAILGHAYLIPFKNGAASKAANRWIGDCQLIIGYRGMAALAWRDAKIYMHPGVVKKRDIFEIEDGLNPILRHIRSNDGKEPGERVGAWVVVKLPDGRTDFKFCTKSDVAEAKASSAGSDDPASPWVCHTDSMWMKTPVRRLWPFLPVSGELGRVVEAIESGEVKDIVPEAMDYEDAPDYSAAAAGAQKPGLPQPSGETIKMENKDAEKVPARKAATKSADAAREKPTMAQQQEFGAILMDLRPEELDKVFDTARIEKPKKISLDWMDTQTGETIQKLIDAARS